MSNSLAKMSQQTKLDAFFQTRKKPNPTSSKRKILADLPTEKLEPKSPKPDKYNVEARKEIQSPEITEEPKNEIVKEDFIPKVVQDEAVFTTPRKILTPKKTLTPDHRKTSMHKSDADLVQSLPSKLHSAAQKAERSAKKALFTESVLRSPESLKKSPADIKKALGSTNSLATLQARLRGLHQSPSRPTVKKALFQEEKPLLSPKLSRKGLNFEIDVERQKRAVLQSPVKASPRKQALEAAEVVEDKLHDLLQPSDVMPLPQAYRELAAIFRKVDELAAIKYNRNQAIPVSALQADVQVAMRKALTESHLKQIHCVFPKAYEFSWEFAKDSRNRDITSKYELYMSPNLFNKAKVLPRDLVERQKLFTHYLLTVVQDHHQEFLKSRGISLENEIIHRWDKEFDVDKHCLSIDELDFPEKPYVESPERNPQLMLEKITGVNQSVEKALKKVVEISTPVKKAETMTPVSKSVDEDIKLDPALRDLPPHLLAKIKAQERERRIREMTMDKGEQKEVKMLEELLHNRFFSTLVNCHNTLRKGKAVPHDSLCSRIADSSGKAKHVVQELFKLFTQTCPDVFAVKTYNKVEQVLGNYYKAAPDFDKMEKTLQEALTKRKTGKS